jgi:hypothetical protein
VARLRRITLTAPRFELALLRSPKVSFGEAGCALAALRRQRDAAQPARTTDHAPRTTHHGQRQRLTRRW